MSDKDRPFRTLGWQLKLVREQLKQTLAEVSGAVEIETEILELIEQGKQRPNEDVLFLLISHFDIKDADASSLWELAGYSDNFSLPKEDLLPLSSGQDKALNITLPLDPRIMYTDHLHTSVGDYGVVLNFMQATGFTNQSLPVARVGMSKEHAHKVLETLKQSLDQLDKPQQPKLLPRVKKPTKTDSHRDTPDRN